MAYKNKVDGYNANLIYAELDELTERSLARVLKAARLVFQKKHDEAVALLVDAGIDLARAKEITSDLTSKDGIRAALDTAMNVNEGS